MDITTFLAALWGPALLAFGVGMFTNRAYYMKMYRNLEQDALAVVIFGMVAMTAGIAQILHHNTWETTAQIVISLLGWGTAIKGALFLVAPQFAERSGNRWANLNLLPVGGAFIFLVGAYLTWFGYFV